MECNEIRERLINEIIEFGFIKDEQVKGHILSCTSCRSYNENIKLILEDYRCETSLPDIEKKKELLFEKITAKKRFISYKRTLAAAVILCFAILGIYYIYTNQGAYDDAKTANSISYSEANDELAMYIENPGDLYYNMELEKMTETEFAMLLSSLDTDINSSGER